MFIDMQNDKPKKSIDNGRITYLSVSSVTMFDPASYGGCERRWWFAKVKGRKEPQFASQTLGVEVHAQVEHYLKTGEKTLGEIAQPALEYLPDPHTPGLLIETGFGVHSTPGLSACGIPFVGYIDHAWQAGETAYVRDIKTTGQLKNAKTPREMAESIQMTGYGVFVSALWPHVTEVSLGHTYLATKGKPQALSVTAKQPVAMVRDRWETKVSPIVARMVEVAKESDVKNIDANRASCNAWQGCPHRLVCPASGDGGNMSKLLAKLSKKPPEEIKPETITPPDMPPPDLALDAEPLPVEAPAPVSVVNDKPAKKTKAPAPHPPWRVVVYVDCMPVVKESTPDLSVYAWEAITAVQDTFNLTDLRLADKDSALAYGKWRAALAEYVRENPPKLDGYLLTFGDEVKMAVADAIATCTGVVVIRSVR
jgi:hypothetical protein